MNGKLRYEVFLNDGPTQISGVLPDGEPKKFSPIASTLIYGREHAVLTDPGLTAAQAQALGDWVATKGVDITDIFITHGHGDHWFAAGVLAERFGARIVASEATIAQMRGNLAVRASVWDKSYADIPPSPVTAVTVPDNRIMLEGHELRIVEVGHSDTDNTSVLHVPDLGLVVAGDVLYHGAHQYLGEATGPDGTQPWRDAIDKVAALEPRWIVAGHQNELDDGDAERTIAQTRRYLDDADESLRTEAGAADFVSAMIARYPDHVGRTILWLGADRQYAVQP